MGKKSLLVLLFCFSLICGILVLSIQHHNSSALFCTIISSFDSSAAAAEKAQSLKRRQVTLSWFSYNHEKKVRKEKRKWCSKMSCNSKIVVKHIRHGITKTLPQLTHYVWFSWFWSHLKMSQNMPMWLHDYLRD